MKIVFLDANTIGKDIDLSGFSQFGELVCHESSTLEEAAIRTQDADILIVNKVLMNEQTIGNAKNLKLICVAATGINNLDLDYLNSRGILWKNVAGYSTEAVAQHTFAMLFYLLEHLPYYDNYVKSGRYIQSGCFTHLDRQFTQLNHMTWGIIGLGAIGKRVADLARAFGSRVIYYSTGGKNNQPGYERVELDTLLRESDIVSIHAPLNENTEHLMNREAFSKMKSSAILLNVGRGPIVVEEDLAEALKEGTIAAAGLDVLCKEPMSPSNPLMALKDSDRLLITPHIAWATVEARQKLMELVYKNIEDYVKNPVPIT